MDRPSFSKTVTFAFGAGVEYVDIRVVFGRAVPPGLPEQTWVSYEVAAKVSRG